jgi:UDP-N-acetylglucosamine--N-acetylmuramyl-(pentapeptide) pyrophosphoryl-undecaprenol N-acetylglucosamine transferase
MPIEGLEGERYRVVGRPVDPRFFTVTREQARATYAIAADEHVVTVFGGSLGAGRLNDAVAAAYGEEDPAAPLVLQVTGRGKLAGSTPHDRLRVFEYCDSMPELLHAADVVVCRAGGSIWEVAAAGVPAVLVPWSGAAGDHQAANAAYFGAGAVVVPDGALDGPRLRAEVAGLLADDDRRTRLAAAMHALARPDAARDVADEVLALAGVAA